MLGSVVEQPLFSIISHQEGRQRSPSIGVKIASRIFIYHVTNFVSPGQATDHEKADIKEN